MLVLWPGFNVGGAFGEGINKRLNDHDTALRAFERGEVLPLEAVLSEVRKAVRGEVVGIELERERGNGNWVYEFKIIAPGSIMVEVYVDARTAEILKARGE